LHCRASDLDALKPVPYGPPNPRTFRRAVCLRKEPPDSWWGQIHPSNRGQKGLTYSADPLDAVENARHRFDISREPFSRLGTHPAAVVRTTEDS
jgi:hypothetical protein